MTPTDRLRLAFDLVETAEQMLRARLRRERIEPEICARAERIVALPELVLPVASTGGLIVMKLLARDDRSRP